MPQPRMHVNYLIDYLSYHYKSFLQANIPDDPTPANAARSIRDDSAASFHYGALVLISSSSLHFDFWTEALQ